MRTRLRLVWYLGAAVLSASCASPTSPDAVSSPASHALSTTEPLPATPLPVPGITCPTDPPSGLTVGQTQGRTDITWQQVGALTRYHVWIQVEANNNTWADVPGAPATAEGLRYEWYGYDSARIHAVRVRGVCPDGGAGAWSAPVVFGGRSGPVVTPTPPPAPKPPKKCTGKKGCK